MKGQVFSILVCYLFLCVGCSSKSQSLDTGEIKKTDTPKLYLHLLEHPSSYSQVSKELEKRWKLSHATLVLETLRFSGDFIVNEGLTSLLSKKTKQTHPNSTAWKKWLWAQDYTPLPTYPEFKAELYRKIDPKFDAYFKNDRKSTIRLDQVEWGGVRQDGIPPLRSPNMIPAAEADYLAPTDIVFGIEVNGEYRAYPNRILAWHEMFVDTIQGVPLAGVY